MEISVLVVEDDPVFRELIIDILRNQGYTVFAAKNGQEAMDVFFQMLTIDLMILDYMLPVYNGRQVLEEIRQHSDVPILILTALGDEKNEIDFLQSGADDFIAKPFSYEVFIARVNNLIRKKLRDRFVNLEAGDILINQDQNKVWVNGIEVELSRKEYQLLIYLIKNHDRILHREQILSQIWGFDFSGGERTIDTHMKTLRYKLGESGSYIKTVRGSGYLFEVKS